MLAGHLVRAAILDRPANALLLLPLLQQPLALGRLALGDRHDAAILVVLQVLLGQATAGVVGRAVHNLSSAANCLLVHLFV